MASLAITSPYILHYIFLHLPQQDLLLVQRVCRTWHDVISSSKVLQAALFLCPEPATSVPRSDDAPFELNPLLQSRFPSFFDADCERNPMRDMGPWLHSHWTESVHPWPRTRDCCPDSPGSYEYRSLELDPRRAAAYKNPKASWRRMIPCMPPPVELQVSFELHKQRVKGLPPLPNSSTLRCLTFSNEKSLNEEASSAVRDGEWQQPWLTFGLLHDIIEAAWFQSIPIPIYTAQFDYTFEETRPRLWKQIPNVMYQRQPTDEQQKMIRMYYRREKLRDLLPGKIIGGPGRIFVHLYGSEKFSHWKKSRSGRFEVEKRAIEHLKWDEEIDCGVPRV